MQLSTSYGVFRGQVKPAASGRHGAVLAEDEKPPPGVLNLLEEPHVLADH